ncbi:hypothetical protein Pcar_0931 [Syntrophotalea carbinolica DSM 2380]|uniref:Uncharacterized protein n=1 Tax=Syntrophotalea carbinolica (strain DSM 2380 / NBRC 103641 / GraBd1) TaxID=338963 RepID=Q3A623_SYNC1|nr:hypothetical protein [Syntrophotalea carbinolica]ABA88184.1 hypothetical protein Pcar_0931 [Syntrophotalea carbinolica DSM 2380]
MGGKIFYRERKKMVDGSKTPRYIVGAVSDVNLKVYSKHMRMSELKQLAEELGAELVALKRGPKH